MADHPEQALGGLMMNHDSQEVCYIEQSSAEESSVYNCIDSNMIQHRMAMMQSNNHPQMPCENQQQTYSHEHQDNFDRCKVTNLQEAFFKPNSNTTEQPVLETSS